MIAERKDRERTIPVASKAFHNVLDKVGNTNIGNDVAWQEMQPVLASFVEDYPAKYSPYINTIRTVFALRRDAYLGRILSTAASNEVKKTLLSLDNTTQDELTPFVVYFRDIFQLPSYRAKIRRNHRS